MEDCPDLLPLSTKSLDEFKKNARDWLEQYRACKFKHQILKEAIEHYNQK